MDSNVDKGTIVEIHVKNFVTYDDAVIKPGRNLNVIIGPNGTGKSTIVCAIVLGLGGKPKVIGRALHVGEYVKAGHKEASIVIELKNSGKSNIKIARHFTANGQSTWKLNGTTSSLKEVEALTSSLNIQVDNLCQFLPQDKVQDFSKMNPQQLLENTERSVGDPLLLDYHIKLKNFRKQQVELEEYISKKENLLERQSQKYDSLKEIVGSIKERTGIKRKIETLKQKKCWILYDNARTRLMEEKQQSDEAVKNMNTLLETMKPVQTAVSQIKEEMKKKELAVNRLIEQASRTARNVSVLIEDLDGHGDKIKELVRACAEKVRAEATRDHEIATALQQKSKLEYDLELIIKECDSEESLLEQQQRILPLMEQHRKFINGLLNKSAKCKQEEDRIRQEIRNHTMELQAVKDVEKQRLSLLKQRSTDAHDGVIWLRNNGNIFSGVVHEPMLLKINVKNAKYAKYFESILPNRDLCAFVCENRQDMNLLLSQLRDQKRLQVNCIHSDPNKNVSMQPHVPLENITKYGFEHYLTSLIDAPQTIMKYLVSMYRINNIPVGSKKVEEAVDKVPKALQCFYSENNLYSVSMSKYSGQKSTRMSKVTGDGSLSIILNASKLRDITEKLAVLNEQQENSVKQSKKMEEDLKDAEAQMENFRTQRKDCQRRVDQIRTVKSRISVINKTIQDLRSNRTSTEEIERTHKIKIQNILDQQLKAYQRYNESLAKYIESNNLCSMAKLELKLIQQRLGSKQNEYYEMQEKYKHAERIVRQFEAELQPMKIEVKRLYTEALNSTSGIGPKDKQFDKLNKAFSKLPASVAEINAELKLSQAKVFCLSSAPDAGDVLKEYEKVKNDVENLKEDVQNCKSKLEKIIQSMEVIRGKWMPPLEQLVDNINTNFSSYFASINCAGEVSIAHGENILDFEEYGLKIKVKFRDTDELQDLTRHHQSGGERAVTTAIYMIALQELSTVPFRCVDEINQGMDAINERRVFELIVKITGKPNGSQYFLLTPKLLPALLYAPTVTVHCVLNGPFAISHDKFDMNEYCQRTQCDSDDE